MICNAWRLFILVFAALQSFAISYKTSAIAGSKIHSIIFPINSHKIYVSKALSGSIGRETLKSISLREKAIASINGSYFDEGGKFNGSPSFFLKMQDKIYIREGSFPIAYLDNMNKLHIRKFDFAPKVKFKDKFYNCNLNIPQKNSEIYVYDQSYHHTTLTNPDFQEIIVQNNQIIGINEKGNSKIPENGFVIAYRNKEIFSDIKIGDEVSLSLNLPEEIEKASFAIAGSDIILENGLEIENKSSEFYTSPYARSAICIMNNNNVGIFAAEDNAASNLKDQTIGEFVSFFKNTGMSKQEIVEMPLKNLTTIYMKDQKFSTTGLALKDFATSLKSLGASTCLNLDGGSSTSIFYDGEVLFHSGKKEPEIADAIIIK